MTDQEIEDAINALEDDLIINGQNTKVVKVLRALFDRILTNEQHVTGKARQ